MQSITELKDYAENKTKECRMERRSMEIWLRALTPANFFLVGMAGLLSAIAGASILIELGPPFETMAGIFALISSALTVIHNRLRCDPHQAEIRRLKKGYYGLETDYGSLSIKDDAEVISAEIARLDSELGHLHKTTDEVPSRRSIKRAREEVYGADG